MYNITEIRIVCYLGCILFISVGHFWSLWISYGSLWVGVDILCIIVATLWIFFESEYGLVISRSVDVGLDILLVRVVRLVS